MKYYKIVGIVLSGGNSTRFGEPKAFYQINGKYLIQYSIEAMKRLVERIVVVTQPNFIDILQGNTTYDVIVDAEEFEGDGPLAGIYSAMKKVHAEKYLVLPCDTPFINEQTLKELLIIANSNPSKDAIVPIVEGRKQPLIAIYQRRCLPKMEKNLRENKRKMGMLLSEVNTLFVKEDPFDKLSFRNINFKEDLTE